MRSEIQSNIKPKDIRKNDKNSDAPEVINNEPLRCENSAKISE